ncbi:glutathione synthetase [Pararhizobium antarcticum]|uniref:Glutathione synthetase n=1 Tax=Pararhizobium antarcticum TaxID=1798805 RepID=A0A657M019_9HYPH|nr:glutathione synthetase [Pararhizobium antarcticum]OJG00085.1 glutathione synthetase [Rhizobium sp. 58]OJG01512.1 glutathione synthetase [Pararhizobium antarcticum]
MRIAFFVNSIDLEAPHYTTTALALAALERGHKICYLTPGDFVLRPDDSLMVRALTLPKSKYKKAEAFHSDLQGKDTTIETIDVRDVDVLFLRSDPSLDADDRPWAAHVGSIFGRLAAERGVIVLNDPAGLALAQNKLYFQDFPEVIRPTTLISKSIEEIRSFISEHRKGVILKPLQGSGGKNVFKIASPDDANLNQIFEAVSGEGYLIAQAYLTEAKAGDIRLFLMNGRPLEVKGAYAAFRRVPASGEVRSNMHANGSAEAVEITPAILAVAEMVRPKLIEDGMFMVGLDIVGDKILEINVFTPGGLPDIAELYNVDFTVAVIEALETKVAIRKANGSSISNRALATL